MTQKLKPLLLPQMVEERRKRESMLSENEMGISSGYHTQNSSSSDIPSPVTPTFSSRGHLRYPSSASSMDVSLNTTPTTDSPSSPTFMGMGTTKSSKRVLTDVQEEPQERDEDFQMFDGSDELYDCFCDDHQCVHRDPSITQSSVQLPSKLDFDFDFTDEFVSDGEIGVNPRSKKRRAGDSPFANLAARIGTRFPSFSRKWRIRQGVSTSSSAPESQRDGAASRAASSRSSSLSNSTRHGVENSYEPQPPPTPTMVSFDEVGVIGPVDIDRANRESFERDEWIATTPLLPPLMTDASAYSTQTPVHSPLQSPSVADPKDPFSGELTIRESNGTPKMLGIPSPPLSTKPSISSFHRVNLTRPGQLIPSSEIPPIVIADENDEWANKLGHANFNVQPEPYIPDVFDVEACRQLRTNWDLARCNYMKHLVRTGEHYGVTSNTYQLTEEKWRQTDATWKSNNDLTIQRTVDSGADAFSTLKHTTLADAGSSNIMTKIASLNDPSSVGKFPQLGDEEIVGPMVQVAAQLQRSPSKKAKLMRFLTEKFPTSLGRA